MAFVALQGRQSRAGYAGSAAVDPAVDVERSAGDEAVVLAGEKHHRTRHVIGIAAATEWYAGDCCLGGLGSRVRVVKAGAQDHAGRCRH